MDAQAQLSMGLNADDTMLSFDKFKQWGNRSFLGGATAPLTLPAFPSPPPMEKSQSRRSRVGRRSIAPLAATAIATTATPTSVKRTAGAAAVPPGSAVRRRTLNQPPAPVMDNVPAAVYDFQRALEEITHTDLLEHYQRICEHTLERNVWLLLSMLARERLVDPSHSSRQPPLENDYESDHLIVQKMFAESPILREYQLVKEWLELTAPDVVPIETRPDHWSFTARQQHRPTPVSLDPDWPLRSAANRLQEDDTKYEGAFLRAIFQYIRCGRRDQAEELCRSVGHSWRVAAMRGNILYRSPTLDQESSQLDPAGGNVNRALWKAVALRIAREINVNRFERAVYGALAGDMDAVVPVCTTWEDHVWAGYNALLERAVDDAVYTVRHQLPEPILNDKFKTQIEQQVAPPDPERLFNSLLMSEMSDISKNAEDPFRRIQMYIILNRIEDLLHDAVELIARDGNELSTREKMSNHLRFVRCLTHLILFLENHDPSTHLILAQNHECRRHANGILAHYVDLLLDLAVERTPAYTHLIAFYCHHLPKDVQADKYSQLLRMAGKGQKQLFYDMAVRNTLDWTAIVKCTVEAKFLSHLEPIEIDPHVTISDTITDDELIVIDILDWLHFDPTQASYLDECSAQVARVFLARGHLKAAFVVISRLGERAISPELQGYKDLQRIELLYQEWRIHQAARQPPHQQLVAKTNVLVDRFHWLLESQWLLDTPGESLRDIYIAFLVFQLHEVLFETRDIAPGNLERSLRLADLVADEEHALYRNFDREFHLPQFLRLLRQSSLGLLQQSDSPF